LPGSVPQWFTHIMVTHLDINRVRRWSSPMPYCIIHYLLQKCAALLWFAWCRHHLKAQWCTIISLPAYL